MHELSLVENMLDQLEEMKKRYHLRSISEVHLSVGQISGVDLSFFRSSFELFVANTPWAKLKLNLTLVPWQVRCRECTLEQLVEEWNNQCQRCGSQNTETIAGKDFVIQKIEGESHV